MRSKPLAEGASGIPASNSPIAVAYSQLLIAAFAGGRPIVVVAIRGWTTILSVTS